MHNHIMFNAINQEPTMQTKHKFFPGDQVTYKGHNALVLTIERCGTKIGYMAKVDCHGIQVDAYQIKIVSRNDLTAA